VSLRSKTLIILGSVFALFALLDYAIQRSIVYPVFEKLEISEAQKDINRCIGALNREGHHLDRLCQDWAVWDDSYRFIADKNQGFIESSLVPEVFKQNRLNLIYFLNTQGQVVWGQIRETETGSLMKGGEILDPATLGKLLAWIHQQKQKLAPGIFMTSKGPVLLAIREIRTSKNEGPCRGHLIMGKFLERDILQVLREQICINMSLWPLWGEDEVPPQEKTFAAALNKNNPIKFHPVDRKILSVYTSVPDMFGSSSLLLRADIDRDILSAGNVADRYTLLSIIGVGLLISLVILFFLQRFIVGPISKLTKHVVAITQNNSLSLRIPLIYDGEIGALAREFNNMLQQLSHTRQKLLEQSYRTGMAEIAGGPLNSIHETVDPLVDQIEQLRSEFPNHASHADWLGDVACKVNQIHNILTEHGAFKCIEPLVEDMPLDVLIRESTDLVPDSLLQKITVEMDFEPAKTPSIKGYRILLLQIFANLFTNAAESVQRVCGEQGKVNIEVVSEQNNDREIVHIKFSDNGQGLTQDQIERIFEKGYTTKIEPNEKPFMTLHWCKNALKTMNGRISAESEGPGRGACFHIILPAGPIVPAECCEGNQITELVEED